MTLPLHSTDSASCSSLAETHINTYTHARLLPIWVLVVDVEPLGRAQQLWKKTDMDKMTRGSKTDIFDSICFYSERSANPSNLCVPSKCFSFFCTSLCRHSLYQTTWHPWQDGELSSPPVASPFPISQRVWHPHSSQMIQPCRNVWFALIYIGILSQLFKIESDSLKNSSMHG